MILTGAGDWDYILMAIEKITKRWSALPANSLPANEAMDTLKQIVEDTVLEIYETHIRLCPEPKPDFSLLVAVIGPNNEVKLIKSDRTAVSYDLGFAMVGYGAILGSYLADKRYKYVDFSSRDAAILVAYVLWLVKKHTPGCGGNSTIFHMSPPHSMLALDNIPVLEERFEKWESLIGPLLFPAMDTQVSSEAFGEKLKAFDEESRQLKAEWQVVPILEPQEGPVRIRLFQSSTGRTGEDSP